MAGILVTGGAGYIGSLLVPYLLDQGHVVTVLDRFVHGENSLAVCCANANFDVICGDARDEDTLRRALRSAEIVLPLAAVVGAPACDADRVAAETVNLGAVRLLLHLRSKDQAVIFPCTNSGYGIGDSGSECTEDSPLRPISLYGRTKVAAEKAVLEERNTLAFRFATVFGASPRMRLDLLVNDFVYRAVRDGAIVVFEGHFKRNFLHVRDAARAFVHAIDRVAVMVGRTYNVGLSDANLSKLELCAAIQRHLPSFTVMEAAVGTDPDQRDYIVSNRRMENTGFRPKFTLEDGIIELIKEYTMLKTHRFGNA